MISRPRGLFAPASTRTHRSVEETQEYWRHPDEANDPRRYLDEGESARKRSRFLVQWVSEFLARDAAIFELGCNVGRNLAHLHRAGYGGLHGLEINAEAVALFRARFADVASAATIRVGSAEALVPELADRSYDLIYTVAVLEHIHRESEWIFEHLARITKTWLLTIEDERHRSWRHFPRNYQRVFEGLGLRQVERRSLDAGEHGLGPTFRARLFRR